MPGLCSFQYALRNGGSVPSCCVTSYCSRVSRLRSSSSEGFVKVVIAAPSCAWDGEGAGGAAVARPCVATAARQAAAITARALLRLPELIAVTSVLQASQMLRSGAARHPIAPAAHPRRHPHVPLMVPAGSAAVASPQSSFLFDLDGTLVDSVYQHVLAWRESLAAERIERLRRAHAEAYLRRVSDVRPLPGARALLAALTDAAIPWAIATSGRMESAGPVLAKLGVDPLRVAVVTRDQVRHAKPDPDLFLAAASRLGVAIESATVVGDAVWDMLAARRARALGIGVLSGGYGEDELARAGAYRVFEDPADLLEHLDEVGGRR